MKIATQNIHGKDYRRFAELGFCLYATEGTAKALRGHGLQTTMVHKINESEHNAISLLEK